MVKGRKGHLVMNERTGGEGDTLVKVIFGEGTSQGEREGLGGGERES